MWREKNYERTAMHTFLTFSFKGCIYYVIIMKDLSHKH